MSLASLIKTTQLSADEQKEIETGGKFALLPAGWYEATVKKVEVAEFSNSDESIYKQQGFKVLNVQVRIVDDSPTGKGRVFFLRVPLFQRYLPTQKNPQGAVASLYFDFFLAMGFSKEQVAKAEVAIDQATLGGKPLGIRLVVKDHNDPKDNYNGKRDEDWNEVANVRESREPAKPSAVGSAFAPTASEGSPWGATSGDSELQAAAESKGAF